MFEHLKEVIIPRRVRKSMAFSRVRQYFPMKEIRSIDDGNSLDDAEVVKIDWPEDLAKPRVGIVRDWGKNPHWTKYRRFLENNGFPCDIYEISASDWIEKGREHDVIVGVISNEYHQLDEIRKKYYFLETYLGKRCFPATAHIFLYEDKMMEAYLSRVLGIPLARTHISHDKEDALALIKTLTYPLVTKVNPSSGSAGTELLRNPKQARKIVDQAFGRNGRKVYVPYFRQKYQVLFQEFVPNTGYDIRVILVGNRAFGYYRKTPAGDFRASGMNLVQYSELPEAAIRTAWEVNRLIQSPLLAVDMLEGQDGRYTVIEFSPLCQLDSSAELRVDGVPGVYLIEEDAIRFEPGRYWVAELALREFFLRDYLPRRAAGGRS